jgi:hypothetical protein
MCAIIQNCAAARGPLWGAVEHALITVTLETSPEEASSGPPIGDKLTSPSYLHLFYSTLLCIMKVYHLVLFKIKALSNQMTDNPNLFILGLVVILIEPNTGHYIYTNDLHFFITTSFRVFLISRKHLSLSFSIYCK